MSEKRLIQLEAAIKTLTKRIEKLEQGDRVSNIHSPRSWYERPTFKPGIGVGEKPGT